MVICFVAARCDDYFMDQVLGLTAMAWTALGAIAAFASLVTAVVIAAIVQVRSSRATKAGRQISESIAELTRRSRRDERVRQLAREDQERLLSLLIGEGRDPMTFPPAERLALEKAYFTNPAIPLLTHHHEVPRDIDVAGRKELLKAVIESLPARYGSYSDPPAGFASDFAHLTRLAIDLDVSTHQIAGFVADRACEGWTIGDGTVRTILIPESGYMCAPNLQAASDFL